MGNAVDTFPKMNIKQWEYFDIHCGGKNSNEKLTKHYFFIL